ncbi:MULTISPECIES: glycosyltransferase family 4 protein [Bradyrhizobium]|jgi:glycosyltransferase involved in cell wall biosynthesis|uniref:Glycosyltransferase family 4 protein n=5 Tax=Bradyrhizobium TaxID=374 RepID=A0ABS5GIA3_9BRAD|nr:MULTISPECIES: glycosyltransferase family 1 protein [Bradyrhizobium]MBR1140831.1 glycosyltransferase family 4 protein [Bradyrhizobium denitrificans]MDU0955548.1 glycosyltransferase family 1 protein [Bradyrhizobium sp.]MDU1494992.1 glycosyltransferase family 1 protein [Bradyrhizobium sp.]MDU1545079.1 glycosyltransferase family 1 protein [Bradyrhizobium sp.]MDU1688802.1 glycosyltransferase family 1 protein [Bradyrhizobium sp.]
MTSILIISEALGEPNHKRGIFHFTRELLRSLAAEGHELTLLVETTRRYRKLRKRQQQSRLFAANSRLIELLALYRFLDEADMNASASRSGLRQRVDWLRSRLTVSVSAEYCRCFLRALGFWFPRHDALENRTECLEYIPPDLRHLRLFRKFLLEPGFYSYQDSSAFFRLPPPRIDARGYDIVLIDTPTRVAVRRDAGTRVICVVHDLLPLTDLKLSDAATRLFLSRLATSIAQADELAFVSNYSLERFRELMPQHAHLPARVVYPRTRFDEAAPPIATAAGAARPSFVVIVSAEPRKNLDALIRAFRRLPQADLVVIGYAGKTHQARNLPPNIRFAGYVEEQDKVALIAEAHGLIMPSFAEGFGVPIIEALAANTPVLCSDIAVFREVAGDLAEYFDPFSTASICAAVDRALHQQEHWRHKIRERRSELAARFGHHSQARDLLGQPADGASDCAHGAMAATSAGHERLAAQEA